MKVANTEEWNQDHFENDINENFEAEVKIKTENDLELEMTEANEAVAVFNRTLE